VNADQRHQFRQLYGRLPVDQYELDCAQFQASWTAKPHSWHRAQRIVAYAEGQGGDVLTFARTHWPHYWGLAMPVSLTAVIAEMGISDERAQQLLRQIGEAVRTADERTPGS
jgi:hypothetical protein